MVDFGMRVLQICLIIDQQQGGAASSTLGSFKALGKIGFETSILAFGESRVSISRPSFLPDLESKIREKIVCITRKKQNRHGHVLRFHELKNLYSQFIKNDLIIIHQIYGFHAIYTYFLSRLTKTPYVIMPHGSLTDYDQKHHRKRKKIANKIFFSRYIFNAASIFVASDIESFELNRLFSVADIAVVGLGFPKPSGLNPMPHKIPSNDLKILYMGRITQKKRLDLTIKALAFLKINNPNICLTIAGDGDQKLLQECKDLAVNLKLSDYINFVGWLSSDSKWKAIDESDIFVLNSEDENFAVIVPEVQSRGVPVVVTKKVAFSEFIKKYNSGVVIDSLDVNSIVEGIESILKLDFQDLSRNAIRCASESEWDKIVSYWVSNINRVINKPYVS